MRIPARLALTLVLAPALAGCFTTATIPVPPTAPAREDTEFRGVVVRAQGGGEETVDFSEILEATWTPTSLSVVGFVDGAPTRQAETRLFQISTLAGLRVRQLDPGKTSVIIAAALVGTAAIIATVVTGDYWEN